jgi:hypothetical protein
MSGTRYYATGGGQLGARAGDLAQSLGTMGGMLREVLSAAGELQGAVLREVAGTLRASGLPQPSLRYARSCDFPDYACCDPDLGTVHRDAQPGETIRMPLRFKNTTGKARAFTLELAGELKDSRGRTVKALQVTPERLELDDGETGLVLLQAVIGDEFAAGTTYRTRLRVKAEDCEPQHLTVSISVALDEGPVIGLCCGCDPKVRPLRWYHHYYCDPPRQRQPDRPQPSRPQPDRKPPG